MWRINREAVVLGASASGRRPASTAQLLGIPLEESPADWTALEDDVLTS
jgi:hypothetical protein